MFKNWCVQYFVGGYLKTWYPPMTKSDALSLMKCMTEGHCIKCVKGIFKGQIIYKYLRETYTLQNVK